MSRVERFHPPSSETVARVRKLAERRLTAEEFESIVKAPMSEAERAGILELIAWFRRRYATPAERLAYARRAYKRWQRGMPPALRERTDSIG